MNEMNDILCSNRPVFPSSLAKTKTRKNSSFVNNVAFPDSFIFFSFSSNKIFGNSQVFSIVKTSQNSHSLCVLGLTQSLHVLQREQDQGEPA